MQFFFIVLSFYFWMVVFSFYMELREELMASRAKTAATQEA